MDAAADYAAAKAMLARPLPAYVSYTVRAHVKFDAIVREKTTSVVVRTADGAIVKGELPETLPGSVHIGNGDRSGLEPVKHPAFKPACYEPTSATMQQYEGANLEAIALRGLCSNKKSDQDFDTLYVDPRSHKPVAVTGSQNEESVTVRLAESYAHTGDYVMPSTLYVRVHGTGFMFWLDVLVDQRYSDYRFSATAP